MRQLGEQWIEEIDGAKHMVKKVACKKDRPCHGCAFGYFDMDVEHTRIHTCTCDFHCDDDGTYVIRDLGPVNEDGCLASPWDSSLFPRLEFQKNVGRHNKESGFIRMVPCIWYAVVDPKDGVLVCTPEYQTKQQAIDAWNRRV